MAAAAFWKRAKAAPKGQLPPHVVWSVSLVTPFLVAIINYVMVISDTAFLSWKFDTAQSLMKSSGLRAATPALAGISVMFGSVAVFLVAVVAPSCAGSGIPEVLGFLNGNPLPGLFSIRSSVVRTVGIVFTQAAGFPVGREGPMVAIGGGIGFGVAFFLTNAYEKKSDSKLIHSDDESDDKFNLSTSSIIMNQERFSHVRRIGCAIGGAAGISTAFNAPIGGILYMFEELNTSSVAPKFHIFMSTVIGSFAMKVFLLATNTDVHRLVIYDQSSLNDDGAWDWIDIPFFLVLAAVLGATAGIASTSGIRVWSFRAAVAKKLRKRQPYAKMAECLTYCFFCACIFSLVPAALSCKAEETAHSSDTDHHRRLESSLHHVQYICQDGEYSETATLLLSGAEGAVKHLYSRSVTSLSASALLLTMLTYGTLALGMPGLCVPMGTFIPCMLIGGLVGRLTGEAITAIDFPSILSMTTAPAGVYAVIGSAAMLSGFTQQTVGIVSLLAEAVGDLGLIMPLMSVVYVAHFVSRCISHHGYDEQLIIKKGVPFLDGDISHELDNSNLTARDICYMPSAEVVLSCNATVKTIRRALRHHEANYFPVVSDEGQCMGLTTRGRLKAVLHAVKDHPILGRRSTASKSSVGHRDSEGSNSVETSSDMLSFSALPTPRFSLSFTSDSRMSQTSTMRQRKSKGHLTDQHVEQKLTSMIKDMIAKQGPVYASEEEDSSDEDTPHASPCLPIERIMDPSPYMIQEHMPVQHFYSLFRNVDMSVLCVLSKQGRFLGILTRRGLIAASKDVHTDSRNDSGKNSEGPNEEASFAQRDSQHSFVSPLPNQGMLTWANIGPEEQNCYFARHAFPLRTPSDTDAGSSSTYDSTSDESGSEDHVQHRSHSIASGDSQGSHGSKPSRHSGTSSRHSGTVTSSQDFLKIPAERRRTHKTGTNVSGCTETSIETAPSAAAIAVADMLGPTELRVQLAAAFVQLASSEQKQQVLQLRLLEAEQERDTLEAQLRSRSKQGMQPTQAPEDNYKTGCPCDDSVCSSQSNQSPHSPTVVQHQDKGLGSNNVAPQAIGASASISQADATPQASQASSLEPYDRKGAPLRNATEDDPVAARQGRSPGQVANEDEPVASPPLDSSNSCEAEGPPMIQ